MGDSKRKLIDEMKGEDFLPFLSPVSIFPAAEKRAPLSKLLLKPDTFARPWKYQYQLALPADTVYQVPLEPASPHFRGSNTSRRAI